MSRKKKLITIKTNNICVYTMDKGSSLIFFSFQGSIM